jgi:diguanylate cyclase (GGDEF)-like protein/PAS domain S-box-containing protein
MLDSEKTREQLIAELEAARIRIASLEEKMLLHAHPPKEAGPCACPSVIDYLTSPVFVKSISGIYLDCNKAFEGFLQLPRDKIVGKTAFDIAPKELAKKYEEMDKRLYQEGGVQSYEFEVRKSTGEIRKVWFKKSIFPDDSGSPGGFIGEVLDITERKLAEEALRDKEEQLRTLINAMPEIICFKDGQGYWLEANSFDLDLFQLTGVAYRGKKDSDLAAFSPFYRDAFLTCEASDECAWSVGGPSRTEETIPRPDGSPLVFDIIKIPMFHQDGQRKGLLVVGRDITERKRAEEALLRAKLAAELAHKEWEGTFDAVPDLIALIDTNYRILRVNRAMAEKIGSSFENIVGGHCYEVVHGLPHPPPFCPHVKLVASGKAERCEFVDAHWGCTFDVTVTALRDASGTILGSVHVMRDITDRKQMELALQKAASTDRLTEIHNREKIEHELKKELERSRRYASPMSIVMFDIDHFKNINDTYGHSIGDLVLKDIARIVSDNIRSVDSVGRWGGDEFMVVLPETDSKAAGQVAEKLRLLIERSEINNIHGITSSFGVAQLETEESPSAIFKRVDDALYQAKRTGRNRVEIA